jgi:hypothetical protein
MILLNEEVTDVPPAIIAQRVERDMIVKLSGYGCTRQGGDGGNDGIFRDGNARVINVPADDSTQFDFVTYGQAALCFGDSGGPAWFSVPGETFPDGRTKRYVVGVNSKGNISTTSYVSYLQKTKTKEFISAWASQHNVEVCGINADCEKPEIIDPENLTCDQAFKITDRCLYQVERPEIELCRKAVERLTQCIEENNGQN